MRTIKVPEAAMRAAMDAVPAGTHVVVPVEVDWPELRLTNEEILANAIAAVGGYPLPYPNHQIIQVELPVMWEGQ